MAIIQCADNNEFDYTQSLICGSSNEFNYGNDIECADNNQFNYFPTINCSSNNEFFYFSTENYEVLTFNTGSYLKYIQPMLVPKLTFVNGGTRTDYTPYLKSYNYIRTLGGKTYCDITLVEFGQGNDVPTPPYIEDFVTHQGSGHFKDKIVSEQANSTSPLNGGVCGFSFNYHQFSAGRHFILEQSIGYSGGTFSTYTGAYLVPSSISFDGTELNIRCEDWTVLLEKENQIFTPDIDADNGHPMSAYGAIKQMCSSEGINKVVFGFKDYPIRLLRRTQGRKIDWIDQITNIRQAKRYWIGDTLYIKTISPADLQAPKWSLNAGDHIIEGSLELDMDLSDYRNKFTIARTAPNGGIIGEQECIGYECVGRTGNINFDTPVNYASGVVEVTNGVIEDFVYFTESDVPVFDGIQFGPSGLYILSAAPVNNVKFTYRPQIGGNLQQYTTQPGSPAPQGNYGSNVTTWSFMPRYKVTFYGRKSNVQAGIDTEYKFTAQDSAGITCLGLHQEYGDIEDPIIPNAGVAAEYVNALLKESTRKVLNLSLQTPFVNPFIEPGDCIAITSYELSMENVKWIVEESTINLNGNDYTMNLRLTRGII